MKAMKTVEEMRKSVLAECETICPNVGDFSRVRLLWIGKIERTSEVGFDPHYDGKIWAIFAHGGGEILYFIHEDSDEAIIDFAYMLFGFAERDAVEAERAEMMKTVDALSAMVSVDPVSFAELEAKNAALVAALEDMYLAYGTTVKIGQLNGLRTVQTNIGRDIKHALAANENGGVQG